MSGPPGKPAPAPLSLDDLTPEALQRVLRAFRRRRAASIGKLRTCEGCGKEFRAPKSDSRHCSSGCRVRAFRRRRSLNAAQLAINPAARECPNCKREFTPLRRSARYCSPVCRLACFRVKKREACNPFEGNESELVQKNEAAGSSQEPTADSRSRGDLPNRTSETR